MGKKGKHGTGIEWTHGAGYKGETWNPLRGCSRISEGCRYCYAEIMAARFCGPGQPYEGVAHRVGGEARWTGEVRLIEDKLDQPLRWKKPRMVFVNSMSDLFHESLDNETIARIFKVMACAPQHIFQTLTKRTSRMREWFEWAGPRAEQLVNVTVEGQKYGLDKWPLKNVWLGTSAEDQATADLRIPHLLQCPAHIRWVSAEPLLGPIEWGLLGVVPKDWGIGYVPAHMLLHWIVVGGESGGVGARECRLEWIRAMIEECREITPIFVKQLGSKPWHKPETWVVPLNLKHRKGGDQEEWPDDLRIRQYPRDFKGTGSNR